MKIQQQVKYTEPTIQRLALGQKPANSFNDDPKVSRDYVSLSESKGGSTVWGDVPLKNADGSVKLNEVVKEIDLTPRSPLKYGLIAGGIGAAVGALTGLGLAGGWGALAGGAGLGAVAGGGAALAVRNDKVKVVWETHQITDSKMLGYHEYVGIGERDGKRGYFHRFVPDVETKVVGTYQTPRAEHY